MIDKLLKAARKLAAHHELHTMPRDAGDEAEPLRLIETDVEAFAEVVFLIGDYFNRGRSDSHCRACGAPIVWVKTPARKNAPLDAAPVVGLDQNGEQRQIYLSHFATCPAAKTFGGPSDNGKTRAGQ